MKYKAVIFCGSSRAGKTTLARLSHVHSVNYNGLIFEGLFPAYLSRYSYMFGKYHRGLFDEYMERPRFIDEVKSKTTTPKDELGGDFKYKDSFLSSLNNAFGDKWAVADLHAELYYKALLRSIPDVHFCLVVRDPRDCVCAGLYWQNFPKAIEARKSWFYKKLFSWILSAHIANKIKKTYPDNITIVNFNQLIESKNPPEFLGFDKSWEKDIPKGDIYYSHKGKGLFSTPNRGEYKELLTEREIFIIQELCADYMKQYDYKSENFPSSNIFILRIIKVFILGLSELSPSLARGGIDLLFSPRQHAKKQLDRLKQFIKDIKNF